MSLPRLFACVSKLSRGRRLDRFLLRHGIGPGYDEVYGSWHPPPIRAYSFYLASHSPSTRTTLARSLVSFVATTVAIARGRNEMPDGYGRSYSALDGDALRMVRDFLAESVAGRVKQRIPIRAGRFCRSAWLVLMRLGWGRYQVATTTGRSVYPSSTISWHHGAACLSCATSGA